MAPSRSPEYPPLPLPPIKQHPSTLQDCSFYSCPRSFHHLNPLSFLLPSTPTSSSDSTRFAPCSRPDPLYPLERPGLPDGRLPSQCCESTASSFSSAEHIAAPPGLNTIQNPFQNASGWSPSQAVSNRDTNPSTEMVRQREPLKRVLSIDSDDAVLNGDPGPSTKRARRTNGIASAASPTHVESIDLVGDESSLGEALQKQRVEQVRAQESPSDKPTRLSNLTCVICLDRPTDLTATSCGHVFCHTCLMEALITGEKRSGPGEQKRSQCPVCRKTISRNKKCDVIPLLLKQRNPTQPRRPT